MNSRWSGILVGAIVCIGLEIMLTLFGAGVGLVAFPLERMGEGWKWIGLSIGSGLYLAIACGASYFVGGFIASRLHFPHQKGEVCFQGLATWGTASILAMVLGFSFFSKIITSAEKGAGALAGLELIGQTNPRIVTDFEILKGKAVTSVDLGVSPEKLLAIAKEKASSAEGKQAAETARKATAASCLAAFLGMLVAVLSSTLGAWWGRPTPLSTVLAVRRVQQAA